MWQRELNFTVTAYCTSQSIGEARNKPRKSFETSMESTAFGEGVNVIRIFTGVIIYV
jgi:hypothetical protein